MSAAWTANVGTLGAFAPGGRRCRQCGEVFADEGGLRVHWDISHADDLAALATAAAAPPAPRPRRTAYARSATNRERTTGPGVCAAEGCLELTPPPRGQGPWPTYCSNVCKQRSNREKRGQAPARPEGFTTECKTPGCEVRVPQAPRGQLRDYHSRACGELCRRLAARALRVRPSCARPGCPELASPATPSGGPLPKFCGPDCKRAMRNQRAKENAA